MANIYKLTISVSHTCYLTITINGFPVVNQTVYDKVERTIGINLSLIQALNQLSIEIGAVNIEDYQQEPMILPTSSVKAMIRKFHPEEVIAPDAGEYLALYAEQDPPDAQPVKVIYSQLDAVSEPRVTYHFHQQEYQYASLLTGTPIPIAESHLLAYGHYLVDLFKQGKVQELLVQLQPKINHLASAHQLPLPDTTQQIQSILQQMVDNTLDESQLTPPSQMACRSWCGGRIHEIYIAPNHALINTYSKQGDGIRLAIYVTLVNGKIKIVR